jgi:hypothetical protein
MNKKIICDMKWNGFELFIIKHKYTKIMQLRITTTIIAYQHACSYIVGKS